MQTYIPQPPSLKGDERAQLEQMYRYLYKMSEQLNSALAVTDREYQIVVQTKSGAAPGSESPITPQLDAQYRELRSLIIKTADIVNQQMDKTIKQLNGKFEAISSEWGTFEQNIERKIVETAEATIDSFDYSEKIHGIEKTVLDGVTSYAIESLGYIKRGIIGFDDENFPIYGIAVGTELKEKTVEKDGKTYQQIDTTKRIATYTSDAITFWRNDVAIARFSGDELYVTRAEITQQIRLGDWFFSVAESGGLNISKRLGSAIDISENGTITSLVGNINEANTSISQTQEDITALAKRTSAAEDKISSTESKLELKADSATLNVVQETVDGLSGRVSTAESKLELKADSASLSVVETNLKDYVTDKVDGIAVGGRNLLRNTNQGATNWNWSMQTGGKTVEEYLDGGVRAVKMTRDAVEQAGWSVITYAISEDTYALLEPNTEYTLSFDYKPSVATANGIMFAIKKFTGSDAASGDGGYWKEIPANEWTNVSGQFTTAEEIPAYELNSYCVYITRVLSAVNSVHIFKNLKLEKGNKATDWSPAPEDVNAALNQQAAEFANIVTRIDGDLSSLQSQVDGSITTWFYEVAPTLENVPAKDWTTEDDKNVHLGDLYYDTVTGYCYRWQVQNKVYGWQRITDTDVTKALADAKNAQDTADGKRRVFVVEPTPPYDVGDVWMQGADGDILRCQTKKIEGQSYAAADWVKGSKYTNDDKANEAMAKANANAEAIETNRSELTLTKNNLTALVERTTAVEDRVTTAEASLLLKADSAALKVVRETAEGAKSAADAAQSAADAAQSTADTAQSSADSAQSTADSNASSITALTTRVESAEQKITADAIVSTVTSSTSYKTLSSTAEAAKSTANTAKSKAEANEGNITSLTERVTMAESKIDQKADSITLSVLETKVDGISVGGRNLLTDTQAFGANGRANFTTSGILQAEKYGDFAVLKTENVSGQPVSGMVYSASYQPGDEIVVSFWAKGTGAVAAVMSMYSTPCASEGSNGQKGTDAGGYIVMPVTDSWERYWIHFKMADAWPVASASKPLHLQAASTDAGSELYLCGLKLEKGNKATDWSPAPEDPAGSLSVSSDYSKVDINKDRVRIVSKQMEVAVPSDDGEDDVLRVDADGVHAEVVEADRIVSETVVHTQGAASYTPANAGELAEILTELSGKHLTGDVDINCLHVTSGNFEVQGLYGAAGNLTLRNGEMNALTVRGCDRSAVVYVENMAFSTSGVAVAVDNAAVMLTECILSAGTGLRLGANWPSEAWMTDCEGDCTTLATLGSYSRLYVGGIKPAGTLNCAAGSEVYNSTDDPTFTAASSPSIPTTQTVTVSLSPTQTYTLRGTSNSDGNKLYQGRYSSSQALRKGVMLFTLPADLASADNIDSATLTLKRIGGVGQGGGVSVHVRCYDVPGTLYASKTAYENQTVSIDVTSAVKAMKTNGYGGLMLYNPDTATAGSKSYTASYSRFAGNGESGAPVLKISYRK